MSTHPLRRPVCVITVIVALLLAGCQSAERRDTQSSAGAERAPAAEAAAATSKLRIAAWNIEWLGNPDRRSGPADNVARTPRDIADYIIAANVDILALNEIAINAPDNTNLTITQALDLVEQHHGGEWTHVLFPATRGPLMCNGIAWDQSKVTLIGGPVEVSNPQRDSSQGRSLWSRRAVAMYFSAGNGRTDFLVIPVHMKSNYGGDFSTHRGEEAAILVHDIPETLSDPDLIIIGDFNCATHAEPAIQTITAAGFVDLNAGDYETFWRGAALDRAFVPADQPEFARQHFEIHSDKFWNANDLTKVEFKKRFSDHYMVITELDVMPDDD